jgi:hypothetical protein
MSLNPIRNTTSIVFNDSVISVQVFADTPKCVFHCYYKQIFYALKVVKYYT